MSENVFGYGFIWKVVFKLLLLLFFVCVFDDI